MERQQSPHQIPRGHHSLLCGLFTGIHGGMGIGVQGGKVLKHLEGMGVLSDAVFIVQLFCMFPGKSLDMGSVRGKKKAGMTRANLVLFLILLLAAQGSRPERRGVCPRRYRRPGQKHSSSSRRRGSSGGPGPSQGKEPGKHARFL